MSFLALEANAVNVDQGLHQRLRSVRVTGAMALCFVTLLLGAPFAYAWSLDDPTNNQPFPRGLRRMVVSAAAVHFGTVAYRLLRAVRAWEPLGPIVGRLLAAYALLASAFAAGMFFSSHGVEALNHVVLLLPAGWGAYLLGTAMTPAATPSPNGRTAEPT